MLRIVERQYLKAIENDDREVAVQLKRNLFTIEKKQWLCSVVQTPVTSKNWERISLESLADGELDGRNKNFAHSDICHHYERSATNNRNETNACFEIFSKLLLPMTEMM